MVPLIPGSFLAILYRFLRAPLDAGEALFTMMQPYGLTRFQINVSARADFFADGTCVTFIIYPKTLIHCRNIWKRKFIKPGKQNILP
jgi:hypothetical protein